MPQNFYTHLKSVIFKEIDETKCGMPETRTVTEQRRKHARPARNVGVKTPVAAGIFNFRKNKRLRLQKQYPTRKKQGKTDINDPEEMYIKTAEKSGNLLHKASRNSGTNAKLDKIKTSSYLGF